MSFGMKIDVLGNDSIQTYLKSMPAKATKAARLAVNDTIRHGRARAKREIMSQVNLKASYLDGSGSKGQRLGTKLANDQNLKGSIVGRQEPTSLLRFVEKRLSAPGRTGRRRAAGVVLNVSGRRTIMPRAFVLNLRSGNEGLAIRLPKGQTPNRYKASKPIYSSRNSNVFLLYGPSVQQVFDDVAVDLQPELTRYLNAEFVRQFGRLNAE